MVTRKSGVPTPNITLNAIREEAASPEPFILAMDDSTFVTFPDLYDIPIEDAEAFMDQMRTRGQNDMKFLADWLSDEDFARYKAAGIRLRQHAALMQRVLRYYEASMGTSGEGNASAT